MEIIEIKCFVSASYKTIVLDYINEKFKPFGIKFELKDFIQINEIKSDLSTHLTFFFKWFEGNSYFSSYGLEFNDTIDNICKDITEVENKWYNQIKEKIYNYYLDKEWITKHYQKNNDYNISKGGSLNTYDKKIFYIEHGYFSLIENCGDDCNVITIFDSEF